MATWEGVSSAGTSRFRVPQKGTTPGPTCRVKNAARGLSKNQKNQAKIGGVFQKPPRKGMFPPWSLFGFLSKAANRSKTGTDICEKMIWQSPGRNIVTSHELALNLDDANPEVNNGCSMNPHCFNCGNCTSGLPFSKPKLIRSKWQVRVLSQSQTNEQLALS